MFINKAFLHKIRLQYAAKQYLFVVGRKGEQQKKARVLHKKWKERNILYK